MAAPSIPVNTPPTRRDVGRTDGVQRSREASTYLSGDGVVLLAPPTEAALMPPKRHGSWPRTSTGPAPTYGPPGGTGRAHVAGGAASSPTVAASTQAPRAARRPLHRAR